MSKKSFKSGIDYLMEDSIDEINQVTTYKKEEIKKEKSVNSDTVNINIEDIEDEKIKWLFIKLSRFQDELKLWRTGKMTVDLFNKSLKENGLKYISEKNDFEEIN